MTDRAKQTLRNYIEDIGGMKAIHHRCRLKYIKAYITFLNDMEFNRLYDKMKYFYDYTVSPRPMKFIK